MVPQTLDDEQRWVGDKRGEPILKMKMFREKQNLVLSTESTPMKDVGTTVDKTIIPV